VLALTGVSLGVLGYTHVGYPALIGLLARLRPNRVKVDPGHVPRVSVCVAAHNAAPFMHAKLESLLAQDYPADRIEILVFSDGSTDATAAIVRNFVASDPRVRLLVGEVCQGKPTALNRMREAARGEIVVLTDARQPLVPGAVRALVARLGDPEVACVTGNLVLEGGAGSGFYWRYENWIRKAESQFRSMVGMTGPLAALRKVDLPELPADLILDDVWIPMRLRLQGRKTILCEEAVALDRAFEDRREWARKVRTLAGNYQVLALMPALLSPFRNPSWFETISHKVMRLLGPWALLALFFSSAFDLIAGGARGETPWLAAGIFFGQLALYTAALLGPHGGRLTGVARTFVMMNVAAVVGLWRFLTGRQRVTWQLPPRAQPAA
jgi:cellulose synthase/poly-beta-1,6-N-acetylglucosamine synthase-like glycosyltransferase